jgi:hypothetical protein
LLAAEAVLTTGKALLAAVVLVGIEHPLFRHCHYQLITP